MYKEFYFLPEAFRAARNNALYNALTYLLSLIAVFVLVFTTEKKFPEDVNPVHKMFAVLFLLTTLYMVLRAGKALSSTRVFVTPEGLNIRMATYSMTLAFSNLLRVENGDGKLLVFYTVSSPRLAVLTLSNLEKPDELIQILSAHTPVVAFRGIHFSFTRRWRLFMGFVMNFCAFAQIFSGSFTLVVGVGIVLLALFVYQLVIYLRFRKEISITIQLISSFVLVLFSIFRIVTGLSWMGKGFPFHSLFDFRCGEKI